MKSTKACYNALQLFQRAYNDLGARGQRGFHWIPQYYSWLLQFLACLYFCRGIFWQASLPLNLKTLNKRAMCWFREARWNTQFLCELRFPHRDEKNLWTLLVLLLTVFCFWRKWWVPEMLPIPIRWLCIPHTSIWITRAPWETSSVSLWASLPCFIIAPYFTSQNKKTTHSNIPPALWSASVPSGINVGPVQREGNVDPKRMSCSEVSGKQYNSNPFMRF